MKGGRGGQKDRQKQVQTDSRTNGQRQKMERRTKEEMKRRTEEEHTGGRTRWRTAHRRAKKLTERLMNRER